MSFLLNPFVFSLQSIRDFQGTLVLGRDSYSITDDSQVDGEGNPLLLTQNYLAIGYNSDPNAWRPDGITFGSLTPSSYGSTSFTGVFYEANWGDFSSGTAINIVRSGPDTTGAYPTINDYPIVTAPVVTNASLNDRIINIGQQVFEVKYLENSSVTLRFALRTDILDVVGSGTVTVPTGATRAIIVAIGGGGGGARVASGTRRGGGGGATSISDVSVSSGQWGGNVSYDVGARGIGRLSTNGSGTAGGASTVVGLNLVMVAGGGGGATTTAFGAAGAASGGNLVNDDGVVGSSATTWTTPRDVAYGAGGEGNNFFAGAGGFGGVANSTPLNGADGRQGVVTIVWY